ncbi:MAG: GH3 auxin-responsive promoter family protein [Actinomycetota bacterium]|nr:GH3 auxin-responsive promoter family protein [Actinomycetota bacterium]
MTPLFRASLLAREFAHNRRFERAAADPRSSQAEVLLSLTRRNRATAFGREHRFETVRAPEDFARHVPVRDYEGFRPYVERILETEPGVLTADRVTMFATTSGTTAEPKLVPVTDRWREQMASLMRLWMYRALGAHPRYLDGKVLLVVGPAVEGHTSAGTPFGSLSGMTYQRIPTLVRRSYAVPYEVALVEDCDIRHLLTMRLALARSVSAVGTPNPTSLVRLAETAMAHSEEIVRAVHDGTIGAPDEALDTCHGGVADRLRANLLPDPGRARFLERVVAEHGALVPGACWPELDLVGCWLGGAAGLHAQRLRTYFGDGSALRDLGLLASEGRMTIPVEDSTPAGPLAVHANYYEFIPHDAIDDVSPPVLGAHELDLGGRYYILLTGGNGLYRYDINDVVEVVGFHRATPKLAFVRKGREMASITGEKLHVNQVRTAVGQAGRQTRLAVVEFRLIADERALRHDLLVEFEGPVPDQPSLVDFLERFEHNLQAQNQEYRSKRRSRRLAAPRLLVMRGGWSEEICRSDFRRGRRESQHKWKAIGVPWDQVSRESVVRCVTLDADGEGQRTTRDRQEVGPASEGHAT